MSKFKVGDQVKVREDLSILKMYGMDDNSSHIEFVTDDMIEFCGDIVTITIFDKTGNYYKISEDNECRYWTDEMFEGLVDKEGIDKSTNAKPAIQPRNEFMRERAKELALVIYENLDAGDNVKQEWLDELWKLDEYIVGEE